MSRDDSIARLVVDLKEEVRQGSRSLLQVAKERLAKPTLGEEVLIQELKAIDELLVEVARQCPSAADVLNHTHDRLTGSLLALSDPERHADFETNLHTGIETAQDEETELIRVASTLLAAEAATSEIVTNERGHVTKNLELFFEALDSNSRVRSEVVKFATDVKNEKLLSLLASNKALAERIDLAVGLHTGTSLLGTDIGMTAEHGRLPAQLLALDLHECKIEEAAAISQAYLSAPRFLAAEVEKVLAADSELQSQWREAIDSAGGSLGISNAVELYENSTSSAKLQPALAKLVKRSGRNDRAMLRLLRKVARGGKAGFEALSSAYLRHQSAELALQAARTHRDAWDCITSTALEQLPVVRERLLARIQGAQAPTLDAALRLSPRVAEELNYESSPAEINPVVLLRHPLWDLDVTPEVFSLDDDSVKFGREITEKQLERLRAIAEGISAHFQRRYGFHCDNALTELESLTDDLARVLVADSESSSDSIIDLERTFRDAFSKPSLAPFVKYLQLSMAAARQHPETPIAMSKELKDVLDGTFLHNLQEMPNRAVELRLFSSLSLYTWLLDVAQYHPYAIESRDARPAQFLDIINNQIIKVFNEPAASRRLGQLLATGDHSRFAIKMESTPAGLVALASELIAQGKDNDPTVKCFWGASRGGAFGGISAENFQSLARKRIVNLTVATRQMIETIESATGRTLKTSVSGGGSRRDGPQSIDGLDLSFEIDELRATRSNLDDLLAETGFAGSRRRRTRVPDNQADTIVPEANLDVRHNYPHDIGAERNL